MNSTHEIFSGHSHSFDQGIARKLGMHAAVIFNHIVYWLRINASKKDAEMKEGKYWMYESQKQIADFLGYLSEDEVCKAIKKLKEAGLLLTDNFNKNKFDKTNWYTVYDQQIITGQREIKKSLSIPPDDGIGTAIGRNPNRPTTECIYSIEEHEDKQKQQQAAAAPPQEKEKQQQIFPCLDSIVIPIPDKVWICSNYDQPTVESAIAWATHPLTKIKTSLAQAIKWACQTRPEMPKMPEDEEKENKRYSEKMLLNVKKSDICEYVVLNDRVEIVFTTSQKLPFCLKYSEKGFKDQLYAMLMKTGLL